MSLMIFVMFRLVSQVVCESQGSTLLKSQPDRLLSNHTKSAIVLLRESLIIVVGANPPPCTVVSAPIRNGPNERSREKNRTPDFRIRKAFASQFHPHGRGWHGGPA